MNRYDCPLILCLMGLPLFAQNVGIGTSTPTAKLHVFNPAGTSAPLMGYFQNLHNAPGNNGVLIDIARAQADAYGLNVQSGAGSRLYVRGDGRIGVGTTAPQGTVHILQERPGTDNPRGIILDHFSNDPWAGQLNQRKARGTISSPSAVLQNDVLAAWHGGGYDGTQFVNYKASMRMWAAENWTTTANGTYITLNTTAVGDINPVERVRIDDAGKVGIGTPTPQAMVHVIESRPAGNKPRGVSIDQFSSDAGAAHISLRKARGTFSSPQAVQQDDALGAIHAWGHDGTGFPDYAASIRMRAAQNWSNTARGTYITFETTPLNSTAMTEKVRITADGNVGIGTPTPTQRLDVVGSLAWGVFNVPYPTTPTGHGIIGRGPTSNYRIALQDASGRVNHYWNSYYDGSSHRYVVANEYACRLIMGWGWAAEALRFQIAPQAPAAGAPITWTDVLMVDYNGNVGIGTTTPTERLHVNGNVRATAFIADKYPRVVANVEVLSPNVTILNASNWIPVPSSSNTTNMEVSVTVDGPTDLYLVTYAYRVQQTTGALKWTGIRVLQGATTVKFIHCEGANGNRSDYGASGSIFVTGLAAGTYTFRLEDHSTSNENRSFVSERQLLVYRLR